MYTPDIDELRNPSAHRYAIIKRNDGSTKKVPLRVNSKSYFLKFLKNSLPTQSHTENNIIDACLDEREIILMHNCSLLCNLSYENNKYTKWPTNLGEPVYISRISKVTKIPFFITNSQPLNTIFLTCRGSHCIDDLITDTMGNGVDMDEGKIHQGIYKTATYVFYSSQGIIKELHEKYPSRQIIITGHSLGASVGAAVTDMYYMALPDFNVRCICFAPPPSINYQLWQSSLDRVKTFIIEGDFVPYLSVQNVMNAASSILPFKINNLFQKMVFKRLKNNSIVDFNEEMIKMYPPGQIFLFKVSDKNKKVELKQIFNPDYFSSLVKGLKESNHRYKNYFRVVTRYRYQEVH